MHKLDQKGSLLLPLVIVSFLLMGALGFGIWAFMGRQDYKNNVDAKILEAVEVAKEDVSQEKDAEFAEEYKKPNAVFKGPSSFGTLTVTYPKTWSVYANTSGTTGSPVDGFMHPGHVQQDNAEFNFAFRFQVKNQQYAQVMRNFDGLSRNGLVKVKGYALPKVPTEQGSMVTGQVFNQKQGTMILIPLRNQTIQIWTEGEEFVKDFNKILETLTFVP